jgi:SPP1 family predicted phage head-tail adaptor
MAQKAGKMDRRVQLQTVSTTRGELGGKIEAWTTLDTVWANVRDLSGRETFAAQAAGSHVSKVVTIRHRSDLDHTGRIILDDGRIAIVAWISEVGRREALQIFVEVQQ